MFPCELNSLHSFAFSVPSFSLPPDLLHVSIQSFSYFLPKLFFFLLQTFTITPWPSSLLSFVAWSVPCNFDNNFFLNSKDIVWTIEGMIADFDSFVWRFISAPVFMVINYFNFFGDKNTVKTAVVVLCGVLFLPLVETTCVWLSWTTIYK